MDGYDEGDVRVIVGKERKLFFVDASVLQTDPFKVLLETAGKKAYSVGEVFVDVDSILFEHMFWYR